MTLNPVKLVKECIERKKYDAEVEASIRSHWPAAPIRMKHLIWERWEDAKPEAKADKFNFIVFIDIEGDLDWIADDENSNEKISEEIGPTIARIMGAEARPCKHLAEKEWMSFKKMLGAAIVSALSGECESALSQMDEALQYREKRMPERSRTWTVWSATVLTLSIAVILKSRLVDGWIQPTPLLYGLLGSYTAIVHRAFTRATDSGAGIWIHITEAVVRLLLGMIFGKMCILFFTNQLAPEIATRICASYSGLCVAAFAAGMFDRFIPSMISTYITTSVVQENAQPDKLKG